MEMADHVDEHRRICFGASIEVPLCGGLMLAQEKSLFRRSCVPRRGGILSANKYHVATLFQIPTNFRHQRSDFLFLPLSPLETSSLPFLIASNEFKK